MKYPLHWKNAGVKVLYNREVYFYDMFDKADVLAGYIESRPSEGAKSPGGMLTNCVWIAKTCKDGEWSQFASKTEAINYLLALRGIK